MKNVFIAVLILASVTPAFAGLNIRDLKTILADNAVSEYFSQNNIVQVSGSETVMAAACGPNCNVLAELTVEQAGVWQPCTVKFWVKPADGNGMGNSPRVVSRASELTCKP